MCFTMISYMLINMELSHALQKPSVKIDFHNNYGYNNKYNEPSPGLSGVESHHDAPNITAAGVHGVVVRRN